jgi:hypothetical protein
MVLMGEALERGFFEARAGFFKKNGFWRKFFLVKSVRWQIYSD